MMVLDNKNGTNNSRGDIVFFALLNAIDRTKYLENNSIFQVYQDALINYFDSPIFLLLNKYFKISKKVDIKVYLGIMQQINKSYLLIQLSKFFMNLIRQFKFISKFDQDFQMYFKFYIEKIKRLLFLTLNLKISKRYYKIMASLLAKMFLNKKSYFPLQDHKEYIIQQTKQILFMLRRNLQSNNKSAQFSLTFFYFFMNNIMDHIKLCKKIQIKLLNLQKEQQILDQLQRDQEKKQEDQEDKLQSDSEQEKEDAFDQKQQLDNDNQTKKQKYLKSIQKLIQLQKIDVLHQYFQLYAKKIIYLRSNNLNAQCLVMLSVYKKSYLQIIITQIMKALINPYIDKTNLIIILNHLIIIILHYQLQNYVIEILEKTVQLIDTTIPKLTYHIWNIWKTIFENNKIQQSGRITQLFKMGLERFLPIIGIIYPEQSIKLVQSPLLFIIPNIPIKLIHEFIKLIKYQPNLFSNELFINVNDQEILKHTKLKDDVKMDKTFVERYCCIVKNENLQDFFSLLKLYKGEDLELLIYCFVFDNLQLQMEILPSNSYQTDYFQNYKPIWKMQNLNIQKLQKIKKILWDDILKQIYQQLELKEQTQINMEQLIDKLNFDFSNKSVNNKFKESLIFKFSIITKFLNTVLIVSKYPNIQNPNYEKLGKKFFNPLFDNIVKQAIDLIIHFTKYLNQNNYLDNITLFMKLQALINKLFKTYNDGFIHYMESIKGLYIQNLKKMKFIKLMRKDKFTPIKGQYYIKGYFLKRIFGIQKMFFSQSKQLLRLKPIIIVMCFHGNKQIRKNAFQILKYYPCIIYEQLVQIVINKLKKDSQLLTLYKKNKEDQFAINYICVLVEVIKLIVIKYKEQLGYNINLLTKLEDCIIEIQLKFIFKKSKQFFFETIIIFLENVNQSYEVNQNYFNFLNNSNQLQKYIQRKNITVKTCQYLDNFQYQKVLNCKIPNKQQFLKQAQNYSVSLRDFAVQQLIKLKNHFGDHQLNIYENIIRLINFMLIYSKLSQEVLNDQLSYEQVINIIAEYLIDSNFTIRCLAISSVTYIFRRWNRKNTKNLNQSVSKDDYQKQNRTFQQFNQKRFILNKHLNLKIKKPFGMYSTYNNIIIKERNKQELKVKIFQDKIFIQKFMRVFFNDQLSSQDQLKLDLKVNKLKKNSSNLQSFLHNLLNQVNIDGELIKDKTKNFQKLRFFKSLFTADCNWKFFQQSKPVFLQLVEKMNSIDVYYISFCYYFGLLKAYFRCTDEMQNVQSFLIDFLIKIFFSNISIFNLILASLKQVIEANLKMFKKRFINFISSLQKALQKIEINSINYNRIIEMTSLIKLSKTFNSNQMQIFVRSILQSQRQMLSNSITTLMKISTQSILMSFHYPINYKKIIESNFLNIDFEIIQKQYINYQLIQHIKIKQNQHQFSAFLSNKSFIILDQSNFIKYLIDYVFQNITQQKNYQNISIIVTQLIKLYTKLPKIKKYNQLFLPLFKIIITQQNQQCQQYWASNKILDQIFFLKVHVQLNFMFIQLFEQCFTQKINKKILRLLNAMNLYKNNICLIQQMQGCRKFINLLTLIQQENLNFLQQCMNITSFIFHYIRAERLEVIFEKGNIFLELAKVNQNNQIVSMVDRLNEVDWFQNIILKSPKQKLKIFAKIMNKLGNKENPLQSQRQFEIWRKIRQIQNPYYYHA